MKKLMLLSIVCFCYIVVYNARKKEKTISTFSENIPNKALAFLSETDDNVIMNIDEIKIYNQMILEKAKTIYTLNDKELSKEQIEESINQFSNKDMSVYDGTKWLTTTEIEQIRSNRNMEGITAHELIKGIVVNRSNLKSLPTNIHFYGKENSTYDNLQETELHINTPVLILHESKDKNWFFIKSPIYLGWIKKENIAYATEEDWQFFVHNEKFAVMIEPMLEVGNVLLDMGVKLPYQKTNKEKYQFVLPSKGENGFVTKIFVAIPKEKIHIGYLPYTKKNLFIQAFKYEGMPYRWGGMNDSVDCSSYIANLFSTFGFVFPRDTSSQNHSVGNVISLQNKSLEEKKKIVKEYSFGLLYQPGHVMLYLGMKDGKPYTIHASGTIGKVAVTDLNAPNVYLSQIDRIVTIP